MLGRLLRTLGAFNTQAGRHAARNLIGLAVCTAVSQLAMLGMIVLAANHLGAAGFGSFIFALTVQNFLSLIGSAGAQPVVVREAARQPDRMDAIASAFFTVTGSSALLIAVGVIAGVMFVPLTADERQVIVLFAVANVFASTNLSPLFDAHKQQMKGSLATTIADVLTISTTGLLAATHSLTLQSIGLVLAAKWVSGTSIQLILYHCTVRRLRPRLSLADAWKMARSSYPILASYFLCILPLNFGVFFLRFFQGPEATGIFGIACQIGALTFAFAWLGIRIIQPHIGGEYGMHRGFIRKLVLFLLLFLISLGTAAFLGGTAIVWLAFDSTYRQAIAPMGILIVGSLILSCGVVASLYLLRFHRERSVFLIYFFSAFAYLVGCAAVVPNQGMYAAAGITVAAAALATALLLHGASRLRG